MQSSRYEIAAPMWRPKTHDVRRPRSHIDNSGAVG